MFHRCIIRQPYSKKSANQIRAAGARQLIKKTFRSIKRRTTLLVIQKMGQKGHLFLIAELPYFHPRHLLPSVYNESKMTGQSLARSAVITLEVLCILNVPRANQTVRKRLPTFKQVTHNLNWVTLSSSRADFDVSYKPDVAAFRKPANSLWIHCKNWKEWRSPDGVTCFGVCDPRTRNFPFSAYQSKALLSILSTRKACINTMTHAKLTHWRKLILHLTTSTESTKRNWSSPRLRATLLENK